MSPFHGALSFNMDVEHFIDDTNRGTRLTNHRTGDPCICSNHSRTHRLLLRVECPQLAISYTSSTNFRELRSCPTKISQRPRWDLTCDQNGEGHRLLNSFRGLREVEVAMLITWVAA